MPDPIKKLVVAEFEILEDGAEHYEKGEKYSAFVDPETGDYYKPVAGFTVTIEGGDLRDRFEKVNGTTELKTAPVKRKTATSDTDQT